MNGAEPQAAGKPFGFSQRFRPGDEAWAEAALTALAGTGARHLRLPVEPDLLADPSGVLDALLPRLAARFELLPSLGADIGETELERLLARHGGHFRSVELSMPDRSRGVGAASLAALAERVEAAGKALVLGVDVDEAAQVIATFAEAGSLERLAAIGLRVPEGRPVPWPELLAARERAGTQVALWLTEAGFSTWRHGELEQVRQFAAYLSMPADRLYWDSWQDEDEGRWDQAADPRGLHRGAADAHGRPKLLARLLAEGGPARAAAVAGLAAPAIGRGIQPIVVTGGSGFIGANLADSFLAEGRDVVVVDNLSRPGVDDNLAWLKSRHGDRVHTALADVRELSALVPAFADAAAVFHFAAQTAVTTSLVQPLEDFAVNGQGTINVLEAVRRTGRKVPVIMASTNKVYGGLEDMGMVELDDRYIPEDEAVRAHGVSEARRLDFCTPYGCSKGVADQYVLDYAKSYDLPTAVLRMSCIYGPRQFGTEDQGWVAHFLIRALKGEPISVYGNGKQVRDILHVRDAVAAYRAVLGRIDVLKGQAFNLGGGPHNAISLLALLREIGRLQGQDVTVTHGDWRQGDQLYFVADTRKLEAAAGWKPTVAWRDGVRDLSSWLAAHRLPPADRSQEPRRITA